MPGALLPDLVRKVSANSVVSKKLITSGTSLSVLSLALLPPPSLVLKPMAGLSLAHLERLLCWTPRVDQSIGMVQCCLIVYTTFTL